MIHDKRGIEFCSLIDKNSLFDLLCDDLSISKSSLKTYKKQLKKSIRQRDEITIPIDLLNKDLISPSYTGPHIDILFEGDDFIAIDKPFNMHGHPLSYSESDNVLSFLRSTGKVASLGFASGEKERGLLYRLDFVTSGVLVYSKSEHSSLVREEIHQKTYLAIVEGKISQSGLLQQFFTPSGSKGSVMKVGESGQFEGKMNVELLSFNEAENLSLVKIELETGLRHQIRAGLAYLGHPILGDERYGGRKHERVYLHAYQYGVRDYLFISDRPELFDRFFDLNSVL